MGVEEEYTFSHLQEKISVCLTPCHWIQSNGLTVKRQTNNVQPEDFAGLVLTTLEKFENPALFPLLGLPFTLIRHGSGAFRKRSSNRRNLETPPFVFVWTENILKTELFKNGNVTIIMWFPVQIFLKNTSKMTGDCCVFKFLRRCVDGKHLMRLQSETFVLKFLRRSVYEV